MNYMAARSIAILSFALAIKALTEGININYVRLIDDVHRYYRTSCVIFVQSGNYHDLNMTTLMHTWSREFSQQRVMTMTITFSDLMSEYNEYRKTIARPLFVVLLDTDETMSEFVKATKSIKPISFPVWFIIFLQRSGRPLEKYCRHPIGNVFNVNFSTLMLVLCYDHPILDEWYAIHDNQTRTYDLATWSPDSRLILRTRKNLYARRNNMFGDVLRVASVDSQTGMTDGFFSLLMIELSKVMNFTMKMLDPVKAYGGWDQKRRVWTGVIGQLVANKADISVSEFSLTSHRLSVVDFTLPLIRSEFYIYFKQPDNSDVQWGGYFKPLNFEIWITIVVIITVTSILLTVMKTMMRGCFSINLISENYINVWGIFCQQGLSVFPNESSMKLALFSIYVSSLVIAAAYSASLISFLTLTTVSLPFSTLEGYVYDGSYKLLVTKNGAEYDMFHTVQNPLLLKMYELMKDEKYLPSTESDAFKQICEQKNLAFYTVDIFKRVQNIRPPCKVVYIESGLAVSVSMILTKGNPYTGFINYHLQRFQLNGVMNKLRSKFVVNNDLSDTTYEVVTVEAIAPTLAVVAGGIILALFILIMEKMYYSFISRFKNSESSIKKLSRNLFVKSQKRCKFGEKNLRFQRIYMNNLRPIGYWP